MASVGVADAAQAAAGDDGDGTVPDDSICRTVSKASVSKRGRVEAVRREVLQGSERAKLKGFWKHQVAVYDFYQDYGRARPYVQTFVAFLIVANFLCQAAQRQWDPDPTLKDRDSPGLWLAIDYVFNVAFLIELLINMYGSWMWPFLSQGWNLFDTFVVAIGVLDMLQPLGLEYPPSLKMVRLFRAFRVFRLFGRVESLKKILSGLWLALPGVFNALILAVILMSIYAVLAVDLFWDVYEGLCDQGPNAGTATLGVALTSRGVCYRDEYYGTFSSSIYTLFQIVTGESWSEAGVRPIFHYYQYVKKDDGKTALVALFFVSFILVTSIVILNVIVAALLDGMNSVGAPEATEAAEAAAPREDSKPKPQYASDLEESMRALDQEVFDLKEKIDALLQSQQESVMK